MKKIFLFLSIFIFVLFVTSCDNKENDVEVNPEVNLIIELIDKLPEEISLEDEEDIVLIEQKYNNLTITDKNKVTNYQVFINKQKAFADLIIGLIDNLPSIEELNLSDKEEVLNVKNKYDNLSSDVKKLITNIQILNNLFELVKDFDKIEIVINLINNLPSVNEITILDAERVNDVRKSFDDLNDNIKKFVSNTNVLEEAESAINKLIENDKTAKQIIDLIDSLPAIDVVQYDDKKQIQNVRNSYDKLSDDIKILVNNLAKLEALEEKISELELIETYKKNALVVVKLIDNLPDNVTIEDKEDIQKCLDAYNNLSFNEQSFVTNYNELLLKYEKLSEIIANKSYDVKVVLNGGYLENMKEIVHNEELGNFIINYYSCDIWTSYSNQIFIYKTSLMNPDDQFTSFLKVGFSFDESCNEYVVKQIIKVGTALTNTLKESDYYILVHSNYSDGYSNVSVLKVGAILKINKTLPDEVTKTLNANINAQLIGSKVEYMITLKGINTLPVPEKAGYKFIGWYLDESYTLPVTEVFENTTVYAKWMVDKSDITTENILNCVSDVAASDTVDDLILENDDATFTWSSSNNKLYNISNGIGTVSKMYQTHKKQTVKVSVLIEYKTGGSKTLSKDITINPVKFSDFSSTPIATYFYTGAISAYKKYNERYLNDQTLFSDTTKETLDIVYYAFIVPQNDGSVSFQNSSYLEEVKELKNHNVRILGCVNGVGTATSTAFKVITADATLRKTFINNLMNLVEQYNLDGLDLDWEAVSSSLKPIASQYNLLCEELRAEMTRRQDEGGSPYLLTMAVPASSYGTATDRFDFKTLNKYLDFINIMSYDLNDSSKTTHLSPLYTSSNDNGYGFGAVYGVNRISSLGFDKNKLIIGCAGYGKAYKVTGGSGTYPALGISGTLTKISGYDGSFASGTVYGSVINQLMKSGRYKVYTEINNNGQVVGSYLYSETDKIFVTFDSKEAVMAKYEYAALNGVGMMCWAYTEDTADIVIDAIYEAKNK